MKTVSYDSDGRAVTGYDLSSVITITIDGKEIENCGDTSCICAEWTENRRWIFSLDEVNSNGGNGITDNAALARGLNRYKNDFGKSRALWSSTPSLDNSHAFFRETMSIGKFGSAENDKAYGRWEGTVHTPGELPDY